MRGTAESGAWPRLADGLLRLGARGEPELESGRRSWRDMIVYCLAGFGYLF